MHKIKLDKNDEWWEKLNIFRTDNTFRINFWPYEQNLCRYVLLATPGLKSRFYMLMCKAHFFNTTDILRTKLQSHPPY